MASIESILGKYDEKVSGLGYQTRAFLFGELKGIIEYPDLSGNIVGYGYGPGYKAMICTIIPSKKGIKLGFYKGSELPDRSKLLTGTGKVHRHVELRTAEDLKSPALRKLVAAALKAYELRSKVSK